MVSLPIVQRELMVASRGLGSWLWRWIVAIVAVAFGGLWLLLATLNQFGGGAGMQGDIFFAIMSWATSSCRRPSAPSAPSRSSHGTAMPPLSPVRGTRNDSFPLSSLKIMTSLSAIRDTFHGPLLLRLDGAATGVFRWACLPGRSLWS